MLSGCVEFTCSDLDTTGGIKSFTSLYYDDRMHTSTRDLPSDALSLHHSSPDLVFAGLRSSLVLLEDLRVQSRMRCVVALAANRRAVIGVKRLKDSAVPWGLVVSAMDDQVRNRCISVVDRLSALAFRRSIRQIATDTIQGAQEYLPISSG